MRNPGAGTVLAVAGATGLRAFELDLGEVELRRLACPRLQATALAFVRASHRTASQPLLSGVDKGKMRTNLGKISVLPQIPIYCVT